MTTSNEYRAEVMKLTGFGLMTPIGTLLINFAISDIKIFSFRTLVFLILFLFFLYIGIIVVNRGLEISEGKNR